MATKAVGYWAVANRVEDHLTIKPPSAAYHYPHPDLNHYKKGYQLSVSAQDCAQTNLYAAELYLIVRLV